MSAITFAPGLGCRGGTDAAAASRSRRRHRIRRSWTPAAQSGGSRTTATCRTASSTKTTRSTDGCLAGTWAWYWTEHLKSEIGVFSDDHRVVLRAGAHRPHRTTARYPYASGHRRTREVRVVAQQIYQFGRNAWVHPYVGAGVAVAVGDLAPRVRPAALRDPGTAVLPSERAETATRVKPVVSAGLKAYISPRAFCPRRHPALALDHVA